MGVDPLPVQLGQRHQLVRHGVHREQTGIVASHDEVADVDLLGVSVLVVQVNLEIIIIITWSSLSSSS